MLHFIFYSSSIGVSVIEHDSFPQIFPVLVLLLLDRHIFRIVILAELMRALEQGDAHRERYVVVFLQERMRHAVECLQVDEQLLVLLAELRTQDQRVMERDRLVDACAESCVMMVVIVVRVVMLAMA